MWLLLTRALGGVPPRGAARLARRHASAAALPPPDLLPLAFPTVCVWGANTDVGKTLFSAGLAAAAVRAGAPVLYLKPLQTGFPSDSDARLVSLAATGVAQERCGAHAAQLLGAAAPAAAAATTASGSGHGSAGPSAFAARTLFAWREAVGPHLAVLREGGPLPVSRWRSYISLLSAS